MMLTRIESVENESYVGRRRTKDERIESKKRNEETRELMRSIARETDEVYILSGRVLGVRHIPARETDGAIGS